MNIHNMSYEKQLELFNEIELNKDYLENYDIFKSNFSYYINSLKEHLKNKNNYKMLKSIHRRYIRYNLFSYIKDLMVNEYDFDRKKYITNSTISDGESDKIIEDFKYSNIDNKNDFIYLLIKSKREINNIANEYNDVLKEIMGDNLYYYYNLLPDDIKNKIALKAEKLIINSSSYRKKDLIIKNVDGVKNIKNRLLSICKEELSNHKVSYYKDDNLTNMINTTKGLCYYLGLNTTNFDNEYYMNYDNRWDDYIVNVFKKDDNVFNYISYSKDINNDNNECAYVISVNIESHIYTYYAIVNPMASRDFPYVKTGVLDEEIISSINDDTLSSSFKTSDLLEKIIISIKYDKSDIKYDNKLCIWKDENNNDMAENASKYLRAYNNNKKECIRRVLTLIKK